MVRTLLIPGLDGSPAPHWQHWWAANDPSARMVQQADWSRPQPEAWETEIAGAILLHPGAVIVAHSLGAVATVRLLSRWTQGSVRGLMLVAPAEPRGSRRLAAFAPIPEQRLSVPAVVIASRNDPWMTFSRARGLAEAWGASLVDLGFAGHVNVDSGFGPWKRGMELRQELLDAAPIARSRRPPLYQRASWAF